MRQVCALTSACVMLAASGGFRIQEVRDAVSHNEVYVAGEGGYHTYRIPSLIVTPKGTVLAFAEGRKGGAGDSGNIDLVLRRSTDGGVSWSSMQVLVDNGPNSASNPCPVVDRNTGTIWLLSTRNLGTDRESDIIAGTSQATPTVWVMTSQDEGATWSTPVEITSSVKAQDWTWYATGPGIGIQTRSGRLVIPANHAEYPGGTHRSHLFYSDDGGRTWMLGGSADPGTNESQVVELTDGRLMLNMRNHPPKPANFRMVATSTDGGRTLFERARSQRIDRAARPGEHPAIFSPGLAGPESAVVLEPRWFGACTSHGSYELRPGYDVARLSRPSRGPSGLLEPHRPARSIDRRVVRARRAISVPRRSRSRG